MKNKLRTLAKRDTPDVREAIKTSAVYRTHMAQATAESNRSIWHSIRPYRGRLAVVTMVLITLLVGLFALPSAPTTTLHLSFNPSLTMTLSNRQTILTVDALNADARAMLSQMDSLEGQAFEQGFENLLIEAQAQGYLTVGQSGLLYDLTGNRPEHVEAQLKQIEEIVKAIIAERMPDLDVMRGMAGRPTDLELDVMAHYGLSIMHARLIGTILREDASLTMEDLVDLSIRELRALLSEDSHHGPRHPFDDGDFPNRPDVPKRPDTPGPPNLPNQNN